MAKRRKSGEGTVRLRKDGRWEGRIVVGYDDRGLPKTKSVLTKIKTECVERLEALKEELGEYASKTTPDTRPQKPPREKFELVGASTDGREQARSIRSAKTCGKEDTRLISTVSESSETCTPQASRNASKSSLN